MRLVTASILVVLAFTVACSTGAPPRQTETLVALNEGTFFTDPEGNETRVEAGTYKVLPGAEGTIRLQSTSGGKATDVLAVETTHGAVIESPQAVRFDESADVSRVVLLMPDSKGLEAWGSRSGIKTRGRGAPLEMRIEMLIEQRDDLLQQIQDAQQRITELGEPLAEFDQRNEDLLLQREEIERQMAELPEDDPNTDQAREGFEHELTVIDEQIQELQNEMQAAQQEASDLQEQINQLHQQVAALDRRIQSLMERLHR